MAREQRTDSLQEQQNIASARQIEPPSNVPLQDHHLPFFASVIDRKAAAHWTPVEIEIAALLARDLYMAELQSRLLEKEGAIIKRPKSGPMKNPRSAELHGAVARIRGHMRTLFGSVDNRGQRNRADAGRQIEKDLKTEDDLIARPATTH